MRVGIKYNYINKIQSMGCILESCCKDNSNVQNPPMQRSKNNPKRIIPQQPQPPSPKPAEPQSTQNISKVKHNDRVATEATRSTDTVFHIDQIDAKIIEAHKTASRGNEADAVQILDKIVKTIHESQDRSMKMMQKMAYAYAQRAALTTKQNGGSQTFYKCSTQALKIYKLDEVNYVDQIIALLNNVALREQQEKRYEEAIKKHEEIRTIQQRYISIGDERTAVTQNNLACLYYQTKQKEKGQALFQKLIKQVKTYPTSNQMKVLIEKNYEYYKRY